MQPIDSPRRRALRAVWVLLLGLAALAVALPLADTTSRGPSQMAKPSRKWTSQGPVYCIELPYEESPPIPPGPNREQFAAVCRLCHSPRLVLTQPRFSSKKWAEVVHKMVVVYGAPLPADQEPAIVAYLTAVHGRQP